MKPIRTYILIADGARARLLLSEGRTKALTEVPSSDERQTLKPDHELERDRPGRVHESANVSRHAIERPDLHQVEKEKFAVALAAKLDKRLENDEFDRLLVVAAPETLGVIRTALSEKLRAVVLGEVPKDLTKVPNGSVREYIGDEFPI
ncbi:Host attachment protein [Rhodomicrobium vannielii ATCC 17100]|uniref:Host attachment protein n=1 Tax=Rhodomicrobium vannielii (strain ATCC 17100 / DSM 162 / LMG 4299 / NCIMB 10020 / ATH 3.1.1) TaxID=648757 RepID=E3I6S9_RHOVT|nr:host attachment protein [Rhodomicrobium vannielii]ADP71797.1 Host attachment protein [Rhodomicrobium vannielii ATCC 17100]